MKQLVSDNKAILLHRRESRRSRPVRGLLVRVGIDQTPKYGGWNAPVNTQTWRFMFVPIRDSTYNDAGYIANGERIYGKEVVAELARFGVECGEPALDCFRLPLRLHN